VKWAKIWLGLVGMWSCFAHADLTVASKPFTESYLLAEMVAQLAQRAGEGPVIRKLGLGQSGIAFSALQNGSIDIYPDYSDTIKLVLLKDPSLDDYPSIQKAISSLDLNMMDALGFANTYVFAVPPSVAKTHGLKTLTDLKKVPRLQAAFTEDFLFREDSYPAIAQAYGFELLNKKSINHALKYEALANEKIELTDLYSTDAKLSSMDLVMLEDPLGVIPDYKATFLTRGDFAQTHPKTHALIQKHLVGQLDEATMIELNARVDIEQASIQTVVADFLAQQTQVVSPRQVAPTLMDAIWLRTWQHMLLVLMAMSGSITLGLLLGYLAFEYGFLRQGLLGSVGVIQTIPSLALFAFLIAPLGIGWLPAVVALFLYGLLPIVRNTYDGLATIDASLIESARALGLTRWQRLYKIEMPLATKAILGGIKTASIITIGTATLAALIGAGGYGVPIVSGLALNQMNVVMQGAIPAAVMAVLVHIFFEMVEHWLEKRS
jgi:osmoprotectant transport system permease protein